MKKREYNYVWPVLTASLIFNLACWGVVWWWFPRRPAAVLHYTSGVGIDFIGEGSQIVFLPLAGSVLLAGNAVLGWMVKRAAPEAAWLLWGSAPLQQAILLIAVLLLRRINV